LKWGLAFEDHSCCLGITWVVSASTHKADLENNLRPGFNLRVEMELFFVFFLRIFDVSSWIIPSITSFLFFQNRFLLREVNCSHDVFLLLCSSYHSEVFPFSCQNYFFLFIFLISVLLEIFFFYLKEILLGDSICRVSMLKVFLLI